MSSGIKATPDHTVPGTRCEMNLVARVAVPQQHVRAMPSEWRHGKLINQSSTTNDPAR